MIKCIFSSLCFRGFVLAMIACAAIPAEASFQLTFTNAFNGDTPSGTSPWLTATFTSQGTDIQGVGTVGLTLTSNLSNASEFIDGIGFNSNHVITNIVQGPGSPTATSLGWGINDQSVTGAGSAGSGYDARIVFSTSNSHDLRFNEMDSVSFTITGTGLTENSFNALNASGLLAVAHFQGLTGVTGSGAVTAVPEPSSLVFGAALAAMGYFGIRRRRKSGATAVV